jgi:hypothetical protein
MVRSVGQLFNSSTKTAIKRKLVIVREVNFSASPESGLRGGV